MAKQEIKRLWAYILLSSCVLGSSAGDNPEPPVTSYSTNSTRMTFLLPPGSSLNDTTNKYTFLTTGSNSGSGLSGNKLKVSGVSRFLTIYRSMGESYGDMINSDKNFSFSDYPQANIGGSALGGYPVLELKLESQEINGFSFVVGYSMSHNFTGDIKESTAQNLSAIQNLNFKGTMRNDMVKTTIYAGEVLSTSLSKFTMGQPLYRDNFFERLPWDWYRSSFTRYQEYFSLSSNIGGQFVGSSPLQGFIADIEWLPYQMNFKAIYGRSAYTSLLSHVGRGFPSIVQGYRAEKLVFERYARGVIGLNFYQRNAKADFIGNENDNNTIGSFDFNLKIKKVKVVGELGFSKIDNATVGQYENNGTGGGGSLKLEFDQRAVLWPFSVEFYQIGQNLASVDGSIINSNHSIEQGGATNDLNWDATLMTNIANEVGQFANNRRGINLQIEASITKKLKAQFGFTASQELNAYHDTVTIQHRVNAFSRSRFRPWFQAGGPYGRIKSVWFRTFETINIGNEFFIPEMENGKRTDLLGFNGLELLLKYKDKIAGREIILLNFSSLNTVSLGFTAVPFANDGNLVALWYNDFTAAYQLNKKLSLIGNFGIQGVQGSEKVNLSPDAPNVDLTDPNQASKRVINSLGTMSALGVDFDVNGYTSLHFRTKYMTHEDKNFINDKFSGFENTLELKIFF